MDTTDTMDKGLSRRGFVKAAATAGVTAGLFGTGFVLGGCSGQDENPASSGDPAAEPGAGTGSGTAVDLLPITIGYWGGTCEMPIYVAEEYGYYKDAGLDVDFLVITGETPILLANDEVDAFLCSPMDINAMRQDLNLTLIDSLHTGCFTGATKADSGIKSVADLEGKTVGVDVANGVAYVQICSEMTKLGKDYKQVSWKVYQASLLEQALDAGEIDAFSCLDPWAPIAIKNGKTQFYNNTTDAAFKDYLCCFMGMNTHTLDNDPEIGRRLALSMKEACAYINGHAEEVTKMAIEKGYIATDDVELCTELVESYDFLAGDETRFYESVREHIMENYRADTLDDAPENPDELDTYIDNLTDKVTTYMGG